MSKEKRIKELEEIVEEARHALRTASKVQYAQAEEIKRLQPLADALEVLRLFFSGRPLRRREARDDGESKVCSHGNDR